MMQGTPVNPQRPGIPVNQGAAPMPPQGASPQHPRMEQVDISPNKQFQYVLAKRIMSLTPEEGEILDAIFDEETIPVLLKVLPEIGILIDMSGAGGGQGPITSPSPQAQGQVSDNPLVRDGMASRGLVG